MLPLRRSRCPFSPRAAPRPLVLRGPPGHHRRQLTARARQGDDYGDNLGEAPRVDIPTPPPPPPPPAAPKFSRRATLAACFVGSGLWFQTNKPATDTQMMMFRPKDAPKGVTMMRSKESGAVYAMAAVHSKESGRDFLFLVDGDGNVFVDPSDPDQGLYVVSRDNVIYNIHSSPDVEETGGLMFQRLGNLGDLTEVQISGIADVQVGKDGAQLWLFDSDTDPLVLDPGALLKKAADGNTDIALPAEVNDGWITELKENTGFFGLGRGKSNILQPER